ncbi:MAG TPA: D-alanyl-D-alanine carboxypeptidase/D-alanyl-D-alanine-endopeptidase [Spirochaetota bacterium]|nr:D-alanyl-D-alanine carboxypeptidase/D-alanyl-D-alanine-endopeptidase [Spirochaetota bacterium]
MSIISRILIPMIMVAIAAMPSGCGFRPADVDVTLDGGRTASEQELALMGGIPPAQVGFMLYDLDMHTAIAGHNSSVAFIPASTTKVPITVTALNVLGPDYRFKTYLGYEGSISDGVLDGTLYLKGTGDPLLTMADLMAMADHLKKKGISSVSGRFVYDESDLASTTSINGSMEPDMPYNSGLSALSLDYNSVIADWKPDRDMNAMTFRLTPSLPVNRAGLSREKLGDNITFSYRNNGGIESWFLSPEEKRGGTDRLPVKNPALYTASTFASMCAMRGIRLPRPEAGTMPDGASAILVHEGIPLTGIADITLTYSINLMAELMSLSAAKKLSGKALPVDESSRAVFAYLEDKLDGISWKGLSAVNGSGLTVRNRITPEQMTAILAYADAQDYNGKKFRYLLPASGWEGSLANRLDDPETALRVLAKTGSINYVLTLAGYLYTASKRNIAFDIFINDITAREQYDADPNRRSKASMARVYAWTNRAKSVMDGIVKSWITGL